MQRRATLSASMAIAAALALAYGFALTGWAPRASAQTSPDQRKAWNEQVAPFHVIGNIYYVGARGVSAFLIQTPKGSILLDGGLPETAKLIERNIEALGFQLRDVKYLLNSHAHFDHAGGLAELKRRLRATLVASHGDAPVLRQGSADQPPVVVDRVVSDGDRVELGGSALTALVTPGHTKGCTTWTTTVTEAERQYHVVFYCSTSVVARLVGNGDYPGIVSDYERSFARLRELPCDVFLGPHPAFFEMEQKRARIADGAPNPFVDPGELRRYIDTSEAQFRQALAAQRGEGEQRKK
jgi:metallo-beta-lactamase class B